MVLNILHMYKDMLVALETLNSAEPLLERPYLLIGRTEG